MIIDFEHHIWTEEQLAKAGGRPGKTLRSWASDGRMRLEMALDYSRVEKHLEFMDQAGIDISVLTIHASRVLDDIRKSNDFVARVVKENPKRFVGFAAALPAAGEPGLHEVERAVNDLGMKGVQIYSQTDGHYLDSRELWPFYKRVSKLGVPIDVHVNSEPTGFEALHAPYPLYYVVAREFDQCAATLRLCLGGVLEEFPELTFVVGHFAGGISSIKDRIDQYMGYVGQNIPDFYLGKKLISKPWNDYFHKLYISLAGRGVGVASLKGALTNISPEKLILGTDWPSNFEDDPQGVRQYIEAIRKLPITQSEADDILGGNAASILGI